MRLDFFRDRQLGWHLHLYIRNNTHSLLGVWYCKRCDYGVCANRWEWRRFLGSRS